MRRLAALLACLLFAACGEEKDQRGLTLLPDMFFTPAYESQDALVVEVEREDGRRQRVQAPAQLLPPEGTLPRRGGPAALPPLAADAARLDNPELPTAAVLKRGQRDYLSYCAPCHGRNGRAADAAMAPHFSGIPDLAAPGIVLKADGEIYHIISRGRGRMPDFAAQIPPAERWALVHFVRLQAVASLDEAALARLEGQLAQLPEESRPAAQARLAEARRWRAARGSAGEGWEFRPPPPPRPEWEAPTWPLPEETR